MSTCLWFFSSHFGPRRELERREYTHLIADTCYMSPVTWYLTFNRTNSERIMPSITPVQRNRPRPQNSGKSKSGGPSSTLALRLCSEIVRREIRDDHLSMVFCLQLLSFKSAMAAVGGALNSWLIWLIAWRIDWSIDWLIHWLIDWLIDWVIDWLMNRLNALINWFDWFDLHLLIDCSIDCLIDCLIDWWWR